MSMNNMNEEVPPVQGSCQPRQSASHLITVGKNLCDSEAGKKNNCQISGLSGHLAREKGCQSQ